MSVRRSPSGLLSRIAKPIAKAASLMVRRKDRTEPPPVLKPEARSESLTDEHFQMELEQLVREDDGRFQVKLQVVSLVEFREAVGDKWRRIADKVMMIAEGVINLHLGAGNTFARQGSDFFVLLFRHCPPDEARQRALTIAQELGVRLMGDQFLGHDRPLALAAEVDLGDGVNPDFTLNLAAIHNAIGEMRSLIPPSQPEQEKLLPSWMRPGAPKAPEPPRIPRAAKPLPPPKPKRDDRPLPQPLTPEPTVKQAHDPLWRPLHNPSVPPQTPIAMAAAPPLDPESRLSLVWRPSWVAEGEAIGTYHARMQRLDPGAEAPLEGANAYPPLDLESIHRLDRIGIAHAMRDFRASAQAGNGSTVVLPVHWLTLTAENRMELVAPFADLPQETRSRFMVVELFGLPAQVSANELKQVVAQVGQWCGKVALRVRLAAPKAALAADCGIAMIGIDMAELPPAERTDDDHLLAALAKMQSSAQGAGLATYVSGIRRRKVVVGAIRMGVGMINGPALMKDIPKPSKVLPAPKSRFTEGP